jgi:hypothetical protein
MKYPTRIFYTETAKAEMWDRWQKGESLNAIARHFGCSHSSIQGVLAPTGGIRPPQRRRSGNSVLWNRFSPSMKRFIEITATTRREYYNAFLHSLGQKQTFECRWRRLLEPSTHSVFISEIRLPKFPL